MSIVVKKANYSNLSINPVCGTPTSGCMQTCDGYSITGPSNVTTGETIQVCMTNNGSCAYSVSSYSWTVVSGSQYAQIVGSTTSSCVDVYGSAEGGEFVIKCRVTFSNGISVERTHTIFPLGCTSEGCCVGGEYFDMWVEDEGGQMAVIDDECFDEEGLPVGVFTLCPSSSYSVAHASHATSVEGQDCCGVKNVSYSSSNPSVATVSAGGSITIVGPGKTMITASATNCDGVTALQGNSFGIVVLGEVADASAEYETNTVDTSGGVAHFGIECHWNDTTTGDKFCYTVCDDPDCKESHIEYEPYDTVTVRWTSSNESVIPTSSLQSQESVKGTSELIGGTIAGTGTTRITCEIESTCTITTDYVDVTVCDAVTIPSKYISFSDTLTNTTSGCVGSTKGVYLANYCGSDAGTDPTGPYTIQFSSSNTNVATISNASTINPTINIVGSGTTHITALIYNSCTNELVASLPEAGCDAVLTAYKPVTTVTVTAGQNNFTVCPGASATTTVTASVNGNVSGTPVWVCSKSGWQINNGAFNSAGIAGAGDISYVVQDYCGHSVTGSTQINVVQQAAPSTPTITFEGTGDKSPDYTTGASYAYLSACTLSECFAEIEGHFTDGLSYTWSVVTGANIATVTEDIGGSDSSLVGVSFSAAGTAVVRITVTDSCGQQAYADYTVTATLYTSPSVNSIGGTTDLYSCSPTTTQLTANYTAGTHPSETGAWSRQSGSVATVNSSGLVTFTGFGSVTIRYTRSGGCATSYKEVTVTNTSCSAPTSASISGNSSVSSSGCSYTSGQTVALTGSNSGGSCYSVNESWSVSDSSIATVSPTTGGSTTLTFKTTGSVTVTYTAANTCGSKATTKTVTNTFTQYIAPSNPSISGSGSVTACTANGSYVDLTRSYTAGTAGVSSGETWEVVSGPATLSASTGQTVRLTFSGAGTANVKYTVYNTCGSVYATKSVTAYQYCRVGGGNITEDDQHICCGSTFTFHGTITNTSCALNPASAWTSNNTSIATISSAGVVTGAGVGTTMINYQISDDCYGSRAAVSRRVYVHGKVSSPDTSGPNEIITGGTALVVGSFTDNSSYNPSGTWSVVSGGALIASSSVTGYNLSITAGNGTGDITVRFTINSDCGVSGTAYKDHTIHITDCTPCSALAITNVPSVLCTSSTQQLSYSGCASFTPSSWASTNTGVLTVSSAGLVTGVAAGTAQVVLTGTDCTGQTLTASSSTITVVGRVTNARINSEAAGSSNLCCGSTLTLTGSYTANGASGISASWSSSNTNIATVNSSGVVTAKAITGSATITYTVTDSCGSSISATRTINCLSKPDDVQLAGAPGVTWEQLKNICVGASRGARGSYSGSEAGISATWQTSDSSVISLSNTGLTSATFTANAPGSATITYTVTNVCGSKSYSTTVNGLGHVSNASVSPSSAYIFTGQTQQLTGSYTNNGATDIQVSWSSSDSNVATVDQTGLVTGVANGTATITYAVASSCETITAQATITVTACNPPSSPSISGIASSMCVGASATGSCSYSGGVPTPSKTWSSSNTSVATITSAGILNAEGGGNATIYCVVSNECGTVTGSTSVTVYTAPTVSSITGNDSVSGCSANGLTIQLTANYAAGTHPSETGAWSISSGNAATVNQSGLVTFSAAGSVTVRYTRSGGCATEWKEKTVTSYVCSAPTSASISGNSSVSSTGCSYASGQTVALTGSNAGGTCYSVGQAWSISDTSIATLSTNSGGSTTVTFKTTGSVDVTYTASNSCGSKSATKTITNTFTQCSAPTSASISGSSSTGYTGCTYSSGQTVALTGSNSGGSCYSVNEAWTISNDSIATLSTNAGSSTTVTFKMAGSVDVTYTASNSCGSKSATKTITNTFTQYTSPTVSSISGNATVQGCSCNGLTIQLTANYTAGTHPSETGAWSSSNTNIATVNSSGLVTFASCGSVDITYTRSGGCATASASKTVTSSQCSAPTSASIAGNSSVSSSGCTYTSGQTVALTGSNGGASCYSVDQSWGISDTSIATLSTNTGGSTTVTFKTTGSVTVTYTATNTCGSKSATKTITNTFTQYTAPSNATIANINPICVGSTATGSCTYSGGVSSTTPTKTWSSSNTSVATVNATSGVITAVTGGSVTISCVVANECGSATGTRTVRIVNPITGMTINKTTHSGCPGTTVTLQVSSVTPNNTMYVTNDFVWSTSNSSVATVAAPHSSKDTATVTLVTGGTAIISVSITDGCGGSATATCTVNVTKTVTGASLSGGAVIYNGDTLTLTTGYTPSDAAISSAALSGGNAYLGVGSNNVVTGLTNATGNSTQNVTVTYTATDACGNSKAASTTVTVRQHITAATLDHTTLSVVDGTSATLTPGFQPANAYGVSYSWASSNSGIASVSNGVVTGVAKGTATITLTATDGAGTSVTKTCEVTVTNPVVTGITVPTVTVACVCGSTATVNATTSPSAPGVCAKITSWEVGTVSGVDSVLGQGTASVTCTPETESGYKSGSTITITGTKVGVVTISVTVVDDNGTSVSNSFDVLITTSVSEDQTKIGTRGWLNQYRLPMFNETDLTKCPTKAEILAAAQRGNLAEYATVTINGDYDDNQLVKEKDVIVTPQRYSFAGLEIAPGPLYYNGSSYEIKDNWNYDSYNSVHGKASGSTYFNFIEMGQLFEKADFSTADGNIENLLDPLDGWRLPTQDEWAAIIGTSRPGSTVNGNAGKHYAMVQLTGVTHASSSTPNGLLLFPDGKTITGKALSGMDNFTQTTGVTLPELNAYLAQGCVFLPGSGTYQPDDVHPYFSPWERGGYDGFYRCSTEESSDNGYELYFTDVYSLTDFNRDKTTAYGSIRLVRK